MAVRKGLKNPATRKRVNKCLSHCPRLESAAKQINYDEFTIAAGDFMCPAHSYEMMESGNAECSDVVKEMLDLSEEAHTALAKAALEDTDIKIYLSSVEKATDALADHTKEAILAYCNGAD
jgi:hypothetical protein